MLVVKEISAEQFDAFAISHPLSGFWQTSMMAAMQQEKGRKTLMLGVYDQSQNASQKIQSETRPLAAALFFLEPSHFGKLYAHSPRGPLMDFDQDPKQVVAILQSFGRALKSYNVLYWSMDPYFTYQKHDLDGTPVGAPSTVLLNSIIEAGFKHEGFTRGLDSTKEPRWIYVVDTKDLSPEQFQKTFMRKARRNIQDALDNQVQVVELDEETLPVLDDLLEKTADRKGFSWRSGEYHRQLLKAFGQKKAVRFLAATIDLDDYQKRMQTELDSVQEELAATLLQLEKITSKKMINRKTTLEERQKKLQKRLDHVKPMLEKETNPYLAAGIFLITEREILCLMSGYNEEYETFNGLYALHWQMMQECMESGKERYNLYGISGQFTPDAVDAGVYAFKEGFGGTVLELPGDFVFPVSSGAYRLYLTLKAVKERLRHA